MAGDVDDFELSVSVTDPHIWKRLRNARGIFGGQKHVYEKTESKQQ